MPGGGDGAGGREEEGGAESFLQNFMLELKDEEAGEMMYAEQPATDR
eukprot:COSAG02_NODE_44233_length_368_cov_0.572491_1_plen_47_part_00